MKSKTILTIILLAFVAGSFIYLVIDEVRQPHIDMEATHTTETHNSPTKSPKDAEHDGVRQPAHRVIAFYFHGTKRCSTCMTIEDYTDESLKTNFADEIKAGRLEWRMVNIEEPDNEHFIQDFQLSTRSVVLVEMRDGAQRRWKNLARVWELVRDRRAFASYITDETRNYLEEQND